ncbi:TPA: hypothetical protein ACH7A2_004533, partial [Escherichia coli]
MTGIVAGRRPRPTGDTVQNLLTQPLTSAKMKGCIPAFTHDDFPRYGYSSQDIEGVKKAGLTGFTVYRSEG